MVQDTRMTHPVVRSPNPSTPNSLYLFTNAYIHVLLCVGVASRRHCTQ
ncbi:MAG: hypothetical protein V7K40_17080 [Nostoc sp.]